jgi:hypothetical protein
MENKKIYAIIGAILFLIIIFLYYKINHSCNKNEWFNLNNFTCNKCNKCPRGNYSVKGSCKGSSDTICKKWNWCNKNQKIIKYGSSTNNFVCEDLGKCANINCKDGEEYIVGWQTCQNLGDYNSYCEKCTECSEDEVDVINCKNRSAHQVNYNIIQKENETTEPMSCTGIYDRVCEPKDAVRLKNSVYLFFNNNQCLTRNAVGVYEYIKDNESENYSSLCAQYLFELSLKPFSVNNFNKWKIKDANDNLDQNCSLLDNDVINIFHINEGGDITYLVSCFDPITKTVKIGGIITKNDQDVSSLTGMANEYISDKFKILDSSYNNNLIMSKTDNNINYFRLMIVNKYGIPFKLDSQNKICRSNKINCKEYKFYLGYKELASGVIPTAYNKKSNLTKLQLKKV